MLSRSCAHRASATPLLYQTIGQTLDNAAKRWPDQEAVVVRDQGVRLTFADLRREVDRLAAGLIALGLRPGERIGIWSPNRIEWILTQYASAKAGLILVNINPAYRLSELEYALNKVECRALVTADRFKTSDYVGLLRSLAPELGTCSPGALRAERLPRLTTIIHLGDAEEPGVYSFEHVRGLGGADQYARLDALAVQLQPDDAINIQFTSGTAGSPKAATLTHQNVINNAFFQAERMRIGEKDRYCMPLPLYHCGGMVCGSLLGVVSGATVVYPGEAFDPLATLEALSAERCTAFSAVPTIFVALLNHPAFGQYDLASLRAGMIGGAPCPVEVMRRIMTEMHMRDITIVYGMTETSPVSLQTSTDDAEERRVSTVGRPLPHVEIKIVDPEGRIVQRGVRGKFAPVATRSCWATGTPRTQPKRRSIRRAGCILAIWASWTNTTTSPSPVGARTW